MDQDYLLRFGGIARLYGANALQKFSNAHVAVIGIGGVGSWVAEALARSGVGEITLVDLDDLCITNINRQIHALTSNIGEAKVEAMASRLKEINPSIKLNLIEDFITPENQAEIISPAMDYVVDCIDAVKAKTALIAYCKRNKTKLITIGGAGGQFDPSQIEVKDLAKTIQDPLLAKVRNTLRREHNFSKNPKRKFGVDAVYSTEQLKYPSSDGQVCLAKPDSPAGKAMDCATGFGSATVVTATFAFMATSRVLLNLAK